MDPPEHPGKKGIEAMGKLGHRLLCTLYRKPRGEDPFEMQAYHSRGFAKTLGANEAGNYGPHVQRACIDSSQANLTLPDEDVDVCEVQNGL